MDNGAQCGGSLRIFRASVKVPDLRFVQRTKGTLLCIEVQDVLVLGPPVDHADGPVPQGLEDAVLLQILAERLSLALALAISLQPTDKRLSGHRIRFWQPGEFQNRWRECGLIRGKCNLAAFLLARSPDDQRDMNNRPGQIRTVMLVDAALEAFAMIGRHDDHGVLQFPARLKVRHECAEGAVRGKDELIVKQAMPVYTALLVRFVMRLPGTH